MAAPAPTARRTPRPAWILALSLGLSLALTLLARPLHADDAEGLALFESAIRPLLSDKCYPCHSVSAGKHKGGLQLDSRAGILAGGDSGPALVAGDVEKSLMIKAVRYTDPDLRMPPKERLDARTVATLEAWIRLNAPDPRTQAPPAKPAVDAEAARHHWAYAPLRPVSAPSVADPAWVRSRCDAFVLERLEAAGLAPAPPASKAVLLRRATLDLTGVPPTPAELDAFLADGSEQAFARVVDRLLANPAFGERWARHWLDLARFAESHGFEHDYDRPNAYPYRDFVIQALNQDLPYDRFVSWQLAGDELAPDDDQALAATGFIAAGVWPTQLTKNEVEKARYDAMDDMLSTTFTAMLGTTVGCARCHDHKYDPISQKDYYRLLATFTTTVRTEIDRERPQPGLADRRAVFAAGQATLEAARARYQAEELPGHLRAREADLSSAAVWTVLPGQLTSAGGASIAPKPDGSFLLSGTNPEHDAFTLIATTTLGGITAIRVEALADPSLAKGGPGRASNGNFALTDLRLETSPGADEHWTAVPLADAHADFEQTGLTARSAIGGDGHAGWAIDPQFGHDHQAVFTCAQPCPSADGSGLRLRITMRFDNNTGHSIGRPRLSVTTAANAQPLDLPTIDPAIGTLLARPLTQRTPAEQDALVQWFAHLDPGWLALDQAVRAHRAQEPKAETIKMMIGSEGLPAIRLHIQGDDFFTQTYLLKRGDPNLKQEPVSPSFWPLMTSADDSRWQTAPPAGWRTSYKRRALAAWMVDLDAGAGRLLARVAVNRVWQHLFGHALAGTPSDIGLHGALPSHPELIDDLANTLVQGGWRLKPLIRSLMLSSTYREGASADAHALAGDPDDSLLTRYKRHRLEAEAIRDSMLFVSGRLDPLPGGPGTLDPSSRRRSIYFTVKRSAAIPFLSVFDLPEPLQGVGERPTTIIAPQALALLNDPQVRAWSAGFAARLPGSDPGQAVDAAYRLALTRAPSTDERTQALAFIATQRGARSALPEDQAAQLAYTDFCQVLLCLNEFIYVE
jgi:hypothetical protein